MFFRSSRLLLLLLPVALGVTGCGSSQKADSEPTTATAAPLKMLHTFEEFGESPRGRYTALLPIEDKLLVGTEDGVETFSYSPKTGFKTEERTPLKSSPGVSAVVSNIRPGKPGETWVASSEGVARFRGLKFDLQESSGPAKDSDVFRDSVWIARSNGLEVYEPALSSMNAMPILLRDGADTSENIGTKQPLSILRVDEETLAVGTQFGLVFAKRNPTGIQWSHKFGKWYLMQGSYVSVQEGNAPLPGNRVYRLRLSPDGTQVAACTDGGLALFNAKTLSDWVIYQGMHRVPHAEPGRGLSHKEVPGNVDMPSSDIYDVAFGDKHLYLATKKGLVIVSREGPSAAKAIYVGLDEGLPSSQVNSVRLSPDKSVLYVATQYGLAAYQALP